MSHASGPLSKESGFFMHTTNSHNLQKRTLVYNQRMKRDMTSAFDVVAEGYTKCRPTWNAKCIKAIAQDCPIRKRALEVGCGSGQATKLLASHFEQLIATDPASKLIQLAPIMPNVEWLVARAEEVSAKQGSVNAVFAFQAAHWFDMEAFAIACKKMAAEGCRIFLCGYSLPRVHEEVDRVIDSFYASLDEDWDERRRFIDESYTSLEFPFKEIPPPEVRSLEAVWTVEQMLGYLRSWSAVNHHEKEYGVDPVSTIEQELCNIWGKDKHTINWSVFMRAGEIV